MSEWYQNLRLSGELDQNNSPFILSPNGQIDFGQITEAHHLPAAPIRLSMGDMTNGYIHINRRHGKQIQKAGFDSIEAFVDYVVNNFTRIKEGASYENASGGKNNTYLIQLQDGHNNTLFVQLSRDGKYWNVNSAGVFGKKYGDKKEEIWSASEVQNDNSAVASDGLQSEPIADNGSTSNGTPSKQEETPQRISSGGKDTNNTDTKQGNEEKSAGGEKEPMSLTSAMIDRMIEEQRVDDVSELLISSELKKAAEGIAEAFGMKVVYLKKVFIKSDDPAVEDFEGNGFVRNGVIYLSLKEANIAQFTFGHELLHQLKQIDADSYMRIRQKVIDVMGRKAFEMEVKARQMTYANVPGYTLFEDYAEEVIADTLGDIITHTDMLPNIARSLKENPSLLDRFLKVVDNVRQYFRGKTGGALGDLVNDIRDTYEMTARQGAELGLSTPRGEREQRAANERFNNELTRYQNGEMDKNEMLHLGRPQGVMRTFLPNLPIVMRQRVIKKGSEKKHEVDVSVIMNMPQHLSSPIFVFQRSEDTIGVLTDMRDRNGKNVCVAIELKRQIQQGAEYLEVNDVRSFHGREFKNIVEPIANNKTLKWVDKEKGLAYLSSASQPVQQEIDKQVLDTATKVVKDFVNSKESDGKDRQRWTSWSLSEQQLDGDDTVRFSLRQEPAPKVTKKGYAVFIYKKLKNGGYKLVPKMLSNDPGAPARTWLNADTGYMKRDENGEPLQNTNGRASVSVNGSQAGGNKSNKLAWRPGKHLAMYPNASQFKSPDGTIPKDVIFFEVEYAADPDLHKQYQRNAWELGMNDNGQYRNNQGGLPYIPKDSYYLYRTNSISEGATPMIITGAYKINRALTDAEAKELNQNAGGMWCPRKGGDLTEEKLKDMGLDDKGLKKMTESFDMDTIKESHDESDEARLLPGYKSREINWEDKDLIHSIEENGQDINDYRDGYVAPEHSEEPTIRFSLDKDKGTVVSPSKPSKAEAVLRDAVIDRLRENGMEVITDVAEGQKVLDEANGRGIKMFFGEPYDYDNYPRGRVEPNLNEISVKIVDTAGNDKGFLNYVEAEKWAKEHLCKVYTDEETGGKGEFSIVPRVINKYVSKAARDKSDNEYLHYVVLQNLPSIIHDSIDTETHPNFTSHGAKKEAGVFTYDKNTLVHVLYGAVKIGDKLCRVKLTAKEYPNNERTKPYSFMVTSIDTEIESLEPIGVQARSEDGYSNNSISAAKLLKGVEMSYDKGKKLLEESKKRSAGVREQRVYHGSGADFEAFDHSYIGSGEGLQIHGYGTYVSVSKGMAEGYARKLSDDGVSSNLYTVEIPNNTGDNYLEEGKVYTSDDVVRQKVDAVLKERGLELLGDGDLTGRRLYREVQNRVKGKKAASGIFAEAGLKGVHYFGHTDGECYVVFNEKDAKITDHVRFFRTANGEAYGFTVGGRIYVDPRIATSETPVHEYAHLWASALRNGNKEEWQNVVGLMKDSKVWDEVKGRYPELKTDDEIADEVIATYSGRRGAERLREEQRKIAEGDGGVFEKAEAISALEKVKRALKMFWKGVADFLHIHYKSAEEVADRVMKDLLEGVDPRSMMDGGRSLRPDTRINVVEVNSEHGFKNYAEAKTWAKEHIARTYSGEETGGKGDIRISNAAINKYLSQSAVDKSDSKDVHLSVLKVLPEVIRESVDAEQHADYKKGEDGVRSAKNGINPNVTIHRLYGAVRMDGKVYRVKVTLKEDKTSKEPKVPHSYEATKIELFAGTLGNSDNSLSPNTNNSIITAAKLLNGVEKSYGGGKFFEDYNRIRKQFIGEKGAAEADHAEEVSVRLDNLSVAREMEAEKKDAKAIKMATGWERGADGKWRYEIADSKLNDMMDVDGKGKMVKRHEEDMLWTSGKLGEVVVAPELFKAYPKLKDVRLETDSIMNNLPSNGEYNAKTNTITIHADELKYLNSILNHEIQHAIQYLEGFARGGSSMNVRRRIQRIIDAEQDASDYAKGKLKEWVYLKMAAERLENLYEKYIHSDNAVLKGKAIDAYWDAMNEVDNHADSSLENVYPDGSARDIAESGYHVDEVKKELRRLSQEAYDAIPEGNMDALHLVRKLENALEYKSDEELYHSLGGEVEARNVQERMGMSAEERRASLAAETEDVAREDQIFLMGDGVDRQRYASLGVSRPLGEEAAEGEPRYASSSLSEPRGEDAAEGEREATSVRLQKADIVDAEAMAEEYGLDADDVRRYAEGMLSGNLALANQAFASIRVAKRRSMVRTKLSEFAKIFSPIEKELYERFGNIDELREEYVRRVEEERSMMEAARKRAEEEQRKREARLEELAVLTDEEIDHSYAEALAKGDVAAAREMLDEAARRKGYGDVRSDYQGVGAWSAPSNPDYETDEARRNAVGEDSPDLNVEDMAAGYSNQPEDIFVHPNKYSQGLPTSKESGNAIQTAIDDIRNGKKDVTVKVYRAVPTSVKEGKLRNGDWVTPSRKYAELHGSSRLEGKYRIIEDEVPVSELWWDGNDVNEWGYDNGRGYRYKNVKNNRKLDDLVTRDDNGNVIPPSKRFNQRKADERYQRGVDGVKPSKAEAVLRDAVIDRLRENGMEVITDVAEGQKVLDEANGEDVMLSAKQKRALETATMADESTNKATVVSSADGTKVQNNLEILADSYKNRPNKTKGFITDLSRSLGLEQHEASQYGTFVTENGKTFTIRVSNHNARVSFFDKNGENNGISIVISNHKNKGLLNDGNAHIIEFFYSKQSLQRADSKPLSDIIRSVSETLYSGEFKDTTGLAERQEVNAKKIREQRVYHGSGAHPLLSELRKVEQRDVIMAEA